MAQWIPKTAWRVNSLNKLYGVGELGLHVSPEALRTAPVAKKAGPNKNIPFLAAPFRPVPSVFSHQQQQQQQGAKKGDKNTNNNSKTFAENSRAMLKAAYESQVPFIDLRDPYEAETKPLKKALHLHHHDILSGAANDILPQDRRNARVVVFASSQQRVLNGYRALRRWGFESVVVTNYDVVADFDTQK